MQGAPAATGDTALTLRSSSTRRSHTARSHLAGYDAVRKPAVLNSAPDARDALDSARRTLFLLTGLAVPLYAFPVFQVFHKHVDPATVFAGLFVLTSAGALFRRLATPPAILLVAAVGVPLLAAIPPQPPRFSADQFAISYAHWLLVVLFFFAALALRRDASFTAQLVLWNGLAGFLVAAFALYQVVGIPRQWPGTDTVLFSFQREPLRFVQIAGTGYVRPTSIFLEPAFLGGYLSFVVALLLAYALSRRSALSLPAAAAGFAGATILVALLATVSWGAYLDFAAVLVATLPAAGRRIFRHPRLAVPLGAALAVAAAVIAFSEPGRAAVRAAEERWRMFRETPVESDRMSADVRDSSWARARNVRHTQDLFRRYPARGLGLGHFEKHSAAGDSYNALVTTRDPWCGWLASGAEMGLAGPLVLAGIVVLVIVRFIRNRPSGSAAVAVPALVALAAIQQVHTGSYIDLWWWYPLSVAAVLAGPSSGPAPAPREV
jgi:hypothetical protein